MPDETAKHVNEVDGFGGENYYGIYSSGWAVAGCSPFKWTKQMASGGGTRSGMVVSYPDKIKSKDQIRTQIHHLIDVAPTILELANIPEPKTVNGVEQIPMQGYSMTYTFDDNKKKSTHKTQYFEAFGNRAIYHDGWFAQVIHKAPWEQKPRCTFADDVWELYNIEEDFSMSNNLAESNPEKLKELQKIFDKEAIKNNVYPLDDRVVERINPKIAGRPDLMFGRTELDLCEGMTGLTENVFLNTKNTSFSIEATTNCNQSANGVILAMGGRFGGYSLYTKNGKLNFAYNYLGDQMFEIKTSKTLKKGKHKLKMVFNYDGDGVGKGGESILYIDGEEVGRGRIEKTMPFVYSTSEGADVGMDNASNVSPNYSPYNNKFNGEIETLKVKLI